MCVCSEYGLLGIKVSSSDINLWFAVWHTVWFLFIVPIGISLFSGICILYCIKGFVNWHRAKTNYGVKVSSLAWACLLIELLSNLCRLISFAVDPLFSEQIFPFVVQVQLLTVSIPLGLCSTVLIVFYWAELMYAHFGATPLTFASKYKIPAYLTILLVLAGNIVRIVFDLKQLDNTTSNLLLQLFYTITQTILAICFIVLGRRLIRWLSESANMHAQTAARRKMIRGLKRISRYVMFSACTMMLAMGAVAMSLVDVIFNQPIGLVLVFTFGNYFYLCTSLYQIFVFSSPPIPDEQKMIHNKIIKVVSSSPIKFNEVTSLSSVTPP